MALSIRRLSGWPVRAVRRLFRNLRWFMKKSLGLRTRILIENRWRLGDEIMALPFYQLVREQYPDSEIKVLVKHGELLKGVNGVVVSEGLSEFDCDKYIFAMKDVRDRPRLQSLCEEFHIAHRPLEPEVHASGWKLPSSFVPDSRRIAAYSCGAGWKCREWNPDSAAETIDILTARFPEIRFVELGKECQSAGRGECFIDKLTLSESAAVLAGADLYIGPDSGLSHLAMAAGTTAVTLFGNIDPASAFGARSRLRPLFAEADCRFCWTQGRMREPDMCPLFSASEQPEFYPCMASITPDMIADAAADELERLQ